jgi:hypothetical protein
MIINSIWTYPSHNVEIGQLAIRDMLDISESLGDCCIEGLDDTLNWDAAFRQGYDMANWTTDYETEALFASL